MGLRTTWTTEFVSKANKKVSFAQCAGTQWFPYTHGAGTHGHPTAPPSSLGSANDGLLHTPPF